MAFAFAGGAIAASIIMSFIVNICSIGLRFAQVCFDYEPNGAGDSMVFDNFLLLDRSVTCTKLFVTAYRSVHIDGFGLFLISCLIGISLHFTTIVIHLYRNHRSLAKVWMCGTSILLTTGGLLLVVKIHDNWAWHHTTVESILDVFICLDAILLIRNKISEQGANENLLRDLTMISAETIINVCLFADYVVHRHGCWDGDSILHVYGSCMSIVTGLGQIVWITYKAYTNRVLARGEEQDVGGGDIEQQMVQEDQEVADQGDYKTLSFFNREAEIAAVEDDGGGGGREEEEEEDVKAAPT